MGISTFVLISFGVLLDMQTTAAPWLVRIVMTVAFPVSPKRSVSMADSVAGTTLLEIPIGASFLNQVGLGTHSRLISYYLIYFDTGLY